jgi:DNA-binding SARP family transcriptional activator
MLWLLGPPAVATAKGFQSLDLRPKAPALLARLALGNRPVERQVLAELLFHEAADPRDSLRWHLSYLRAHLPDALVVDRNAVSAQVPTDVAVFRSGARRILDDPATSDALETLALYRGDLCAGLQVSASADFHNWLYVREDELRRTFRRAAVAYAHAALAGGHPADAVPSLRRLTEIDPYLEEGHVLLVQASEAAGREDDARHTYDRYQRSVRTELHAEPRRELAFRYDTRRLLRRGLPLDELIPLEEITMHVVDWPGEEPPILAMHGSAGHAYGLTALGERLAPDVRFVAVDLRGHGFSDKPPTGYGVEEHVEDVLQLIDALGLERPILLGHSIGGAIATFAADAAGDRVGWLERSDRMELAPLPNGMLRRRGLREALATEWASVARADALGALSRVTDEVGEVAVPVALAKLLGVSRRQGNVVPARDLEQCRRPHRSLEVNVQLDLRIGNAHCPYFTAATISFAPAAPH